MASLFTLEGARRPALQLWTANERPAQLGDNAVVTWMKAQPLPVAIIASVGMSMGIGFVLSLGFLKLLGKSGPASAPVSGRLSGAKNQHGFRKLKVDRGWPETWEAKIGDRYWMVEKTKAGDWRYAGPQRSHGGDGTEIWNRCSPKCTKEQAISRAYRNAKSWPGAKR